MAEPIRIVSVVSKILAKFSGGLRSNTLGDFSLAIYAYPLESIARRVFQLSYYYGVASSVVLNLFARNIWCIEAELLDSRNDAFAESFRTSHRDECNMTAVASAIIGSVAITALGLDGMDRIHWTAYAFFVSSLVFALLSVFCASKQQKTMGRFLHAEQLRTFIRVEKDILSGATIPAMMPLQKPGYADIRLAGHEPKYSAPSRASAGPAHVYLPSPASCILFSAPRVLLAASVLTFIAGVGIYLGETMVLRARQFFGVEGARNVLIVYCVVTALSVFFYAQSTLVTWTQSLQDYGDIAMGKLTMRRRDLFAATKAQYQGEATSHAQPPHANNAPGGTTNPNGSAKQASGSPIALQTMNSATAPSSSEPDSPRGNQTLAQLLAEMASLVAEQSRIAHQQSKLFEEMSQHYGGSSGGAQPTYEPV